MKHDRLKLFVHIDSGPPSQRTAIARQIQSDDLLLAKLLTSVSAIAYLFRKVVIVTLIRPTKYNKVLLSQWWALLTTVVSNY